MIEETADARSYVFRIPDELADLFTYRAGQFLTFRIPWEGGFDPDFMKIPSSGRFGSGWNVATNP